MPLPAIAGAAGGAAARSLAARFLLPALRWMGRWVAIPFFGFAVPFFFKVGLFFAIVGFALKISGNLINLGIQYQSTLLNPSNLPVIQTIWTVLRDFVNIFFILILLVIAFATIFNIKNYKASDLLPKLIIAALLINFSLVITVWVIDLFWVPATVFLKPLGPQISEQIANALSLNQLFSAENIEALTGEEIGFLGIGLTQVFRSALLVVNAFITVWIAFIIWVRIPILIGLMIVSPAVWLGYTIPLIRKNTWDAWWGTLLNWGIVPIPLFGLIYFIVLFSQRLAAEIQVIPAEVLNSNISPLGLPIGVVLPWLITVGLFLGGLSFVKGLSGSMYDWTMGGLERAWGWSGKRTGWVGKTTGVAGGFGQVKEGLSETSEAARERKAAWWARVLGTPLGVAPGLEFQRNFKKRVGEEQEKLARDLSEGRRSQADLAGLARNLKTSQGAAAAILMAKNGLVDESQAIAHIKSLDSRTLAGQEYVKALAEGNFGNFAGGTRAIKDLAIGSGSFAGLGAEFLNARQESINYLKKEKPEIMFDDKNELVTAYEIMTQRSPNEARGLLAEGKKKRLDTAMWAEYINEEKQRGRNLSTDPIDTSAGSADFDAVVRKVRTKSEEEFNRGNYDFFINQDERTYTARDPAFTEALTQIFSANPSRQQDLSNALGPRNPGKRAVVDSIGTKPRRPAGFAAPGGGGAPPEGGGGGMGTAGRRIGF